MKAARYLLPLVLLLPPSPAAAGIADDLANLAIALAGLRRVTLGTFGLATAEDPGVTVRGIALELPEDGAGSYRLHLDRLADNARPARFAPARLTLSATSAAEVLRLAGRLEMPGTPLRILVEGEHDPAAGEGVLRLDGGRVRFAEDGLQPAALSPMLADRLREVEGEIGLFARLEWGARTRQLAELTVSELSLVVAGVPVKGITGRIAFDSLVPPATLPGQQITIARIGGDFALERGRILFSLAGGRRLAVEDVRFAIAGGRLRTRPFRLDLARPATTVTVELEGLVLETLLRHAGLPGLSGDGVLDGRLLLRLSPETVTIEQGELAARGPGTLHYRPERPPPVSDPRMAMLLEAIRNFHFTRLAVSVEGDLLDELRLTIGLAGSNPDFYEGYPVALNLSFEGPLGALLGAGIRAYRLPAEIQRRLQQRQGR